MSKMAICEECGVSIDENKTDLITVASGVDTVLVLCGDCGDTLKKAIVEQKKRNASFVRIPLQFKKRSPYTVDWNKKVLRERI